MGFSQGHRYIMQLFILHLVSGLALLFNIALAQFDISEAITSSASFPDVAITCLGNLAAFLACLVRGRLHSEMAVKDVSDTIKGPRMHEIDDLGVTTCSYKLQANGDAFVLDVREAQVVMLSKQKPNFSMKNFMKYTSVVYGVHSIQLQSIPLSSSGQVDVGIRKCCMSNHACNCLVFKTKEDITKMLAEQMPGTLKELRHSKCLLPCQRCLKNRCHGYDGQELWHVEDLEVQREDVEDVEVQREDVEDVEGSNAVEDLEVQREDEEKQEAGMKNKRKILTKGARKEWPVPAVCQILDRKGPVLEQSNSCICIPIHPAEDDKWTEMMITTLKTKDKDSRGVITLASDALKNYIAQSGMCYAEEEYGIVSLIVPRLAEALVNIILVAWLRIDGFSAALVARRGVRDYIVDSKGRGVAANAFLTKSLVFSNAENTSVCQVLTFRGALISFGSLSFIIGSVNLICSVTWAVLVALEGGPGKWYEPRTPAPSKLAVDFIMVAIGIDFVIVCLELFINIQSLNTKFMPSLHHVIVRTRNGGKDIPRNIPGVSGVLHTGFWFARWISKNGMLPGTLVNLMVLTLITALEIGCMVLGLRGRLRAYGRWIYCALHLVVWVKWAVASSIHLFQFLEYDRFIAQIGINIEYMNLSYACIFFLNAVFVGVRGKWKYLSS